MYRRNMSGKLKKVVMFIRLSILLLLSRPFESKITSKTSFPQRLVLISISLSFFSEHKNLTAILRIRSAIKILIVSVKDFLTML